MKPYWAHFTTPLCSLYSLFPPFFRPYSNKSSAAWVFTLSAADFTVLIHACRLLCICASCTRRKWFILTYTHISHSDKCRWLATNLIPVKNARLHPMKMSNLLHAINITYKRGGKKFDWKSIFVRMNEQYRLLRTHEISCQRPSRTQFQAVCKRGTPLTRPRESARITRISTLIANEGKKTPCEQK